MGGDITAGGPVADDGLTVIAVNTAATHDERLSVPLWWWPAAAALVALFTVELAVGLPRAAQIATVLVFGSAATALLVSIGSARIRVVEGNLHAGPAVLPLNHTGGLRVLDRRSTSLAMGREADAAAYTVTRPWLPGSVRVEVDDPEDDTPYWLLGSRRPAELAAAIERARATV